jgi:hypothetical protein
MSALELERIYKMSKTPFSKKVEILSDLWILYRGDMESWSSWLPYFDGVGAVTLPLCYAVRSGIAEIVDDSLAKTEIEHTFAIFCDMIKLSRVGDYSSLDQMFNQSPFADNVK